MKKLILILAVVTFLFGASMLSTSPANADGVDVFKTCNIKTADGSVPDVCKDVKTQQASPSNPIIDTLKIVLNILAIVAGVGAIILILINGLRLVVSSGDSNGVKSARSGLIFALIGIGVVLVAQLIVVFVLDKVQ